MIPKNNLTVLSDIQWEVLEQVSKMVENLPGEIVEIGVYKGGTGLFWCERFPHNTVHLIDTFAGIPALERIELDGHPVGDFCGSYEEVCKIMPANAKIHKMVYPPALSTDPVQDVTIKLLHLDVDIYESVIASLRHLWGNMVSRGVVLVDDYNAPACRGAQQAVNEFCVDTRTSIHIHRTSCQAWLIKP